MFTGCHRMSRLHGGTLSAYLSCICLSVPLSSCPDEAHEASPAPPSQCGAAVTPRALQKAHMADTDTRQSQTHRGGHHRFRGKHDAAGAAGHVQQDGQPRCSPGPAKPRSNEAWVGYSPCVGEVSFISTIHFQPKFCFFRVCCTVASFPL